VADSEDAVCDAQAGPIVLPRVLVALVQPDASSAY